MAPSHGSRAVLKLHSGGSLRDISSYVTTTGLDVELDDAEVTTLGATNKQYIAGLPDGTVPIEGIFDPTVDGYIYTAYSAGVGTGGTAFEYYPQGTATGGVKYSGTAIVSKYGISSDVGEANKITGELKVNGALTRATI